MRQRGFAIPPQLIVAGLAVLLVAALIGVAAWYVEGQKRQAYSAGQQAERAAWQSLESAKLLAANKRIRALEAERAAREAAHADALAAIDREKSKEVANVEARKERFVSDVVAGRIRLFDPGARSCPRGGGDEGAAPRAGAGVGDGEGGGELSGPLAQFLIGEAARADKVVVRLSACQRILEEDRKVCR